MSANCSTCPFYSHIGRQCRAAPPTFQVVPAPNGQLASIGVWPPTRPGNWCGHHPERASGMRFAEEAPEREDAPAISLQTNGVQ